MQSLKIKFSIYSIYNVDFLSSMSVIGNSNNLDGYLFCNSACHILSAMNCPSSIFSNSSSKRGNIVEYLKILKGRILSGNSSLIYWALSKNSGITFSKLVSVVAVKVT